MNISKWIAGMAGSTAIGVILTVASLDAAWNPVVDIAGPPISSECCQGTTGPVLTVNALNNAIAIWQGRDATEPLCSFCDQMYTSSYTFGAGWGAPVMISDNSSVILPPPLEPYRLYINQGDPDIMMNDSGYAVAVWEAALQELTPPQDDVFNVILSATRASDGTWSPVQIVRQLDPIDFYPQNASVAVNESNLAVTMWNEARGDGSFNYVMASFLPFGGSWTTPVQLDFSPFDSVTNIAGDVELNDNGNAVAIWQVGRNITANLAIHAATYNPLTDLWTTVVLDSSPGITSENYPPEVAIDANGNAVAIWRRQNVDFSQDIAAAYYTNGSGWSAPVILYSSLALLGPYVVMDPAGTATAIWNDNFNDNVLSSRLPLGGTWSAPEVIGVGTFAPFSVQEAASVDEFGNVIAIIRSGSAFGGTLQSILRTVQGGWQPPENIFTELRSTAFANIGLGSCGFALALWRAGEFDEEETFIQGADTVSLANFLLAPLNFTGSRCCDKFATQTKCVTSLSWDPVPCAAFYYIRRNGVLIATLPAGSTAYLDTSAVGKGPFTYTLSVVNIYGVESPGVSIVVK